MGGGQALFPWVTQLKLLTPLHALPWGGWPQRTGCLRQHAGTPRHTAAISWRHKLWHLAQAGCSLPAAGACNPVTIPCCQVSPSLLAVRTKLDLICCIAGDPQLEAVTRVVTCCTPLRSVGAAVPGPSAANPACRFEGANSNKVGPPPSRRSVFP